MASAAKHQLRSRSNRGRNVRLHACSSMRVEQHRVVLPNSRPHAGVFETIDIALAVRRLLSERLDVLLAFDTLCETSSAPNPVEGSFRDGNSSKLLGKANDGCAT